MTKRLSPTLKKRLAANLGALTAREAGRLLAIYRFEAERKKIAPSKYAPLVELWDAFRNRVQAAKTDPERRAATRNLQGLVFLATLFDVVNDKGFFASVAVAFDVFVVRSNIASLIREDAFAEILRHVKDSLGGTPIPVSQDDYNRAVAWGLGDRLVILEGVAEGEADGWADAQTEDLQPKEEVPGTDDYEAAWEAWNEQRDRLFEAKTKEVARELEARLRAGELAGGEAVTHRELDAPVLIDPDGTIPAWVALRLLWKPFLARQGYRVYDDDGVSRDAPGRIDRVKSSKGESLSGEEVHKLAADLYKQARRRPWGKKLVASPDPEALAVTLTLSRNPFLHVNAPDFGRVDWKTFAKSDGEGLDAEAVVAATAASLTAAGFDEGYFADLLRDEFYVADYAAARRRELAHAFDLAAIIDTTRQPFSFNRREEEGMMPLADLLGVNFLTPLEAEVAKLREVSDGLASFKRAMEIIEDRYFDGLPVLLPERTYFVKQAEDNLAGIRDYLGSWLARLSKPPWNVDTASLEPGEPEPDEDYVARFLDPILGDARHDADVADEFTLLE